MAAAGYPVTMAGDLPVVTAPEEITESDADQLRIACRRLSVARGTMVLDLTRTRRCAPAAVRVLARAQLWALSDHGELRLAGLSTSVRADLAGLGPGQRVPCYASVAQALASPPAEPRAARWRARRPRGARGAGRIARRQRPAASP
jgi:anti-anti-sigma regulatory factor